MQSADWVKLFKRIPPEQQDNLTVVTDVGQEVAVQAVVCLEDHFAVLRGRPAGTTDTDKAFIIPYHQIVFLGFQRTIREADLLAMFGDARPRPARRPAAQPAPLPEPVVESGPPPAAPLPSPEQQLAPGATTSGKMPTPTVLPNMTALLDRIRARSQTNGPERSPNGQ